VPRLCHFDEVCVDLLSQLTLAPAIPQYQQVAAAIARFSPEERQEMLQIAASHHVVVRCLSVLEQQTSVAGNSAVTQWARNALTAENARIDNALPFLDRILQELTQAGCAATTIKTLDHWPDFGSDIDLYTSAREGVMVRTFVHRLKARMEHRSWGDRLARKWNFAIPGLPELVEVHSQRLGQTGEQTMMARRFLTRRTFKTVGGYSFPVPAPEERVIVATLQRMYRHFYFRLSDILNTAGLVDSRSIDYVELHAAASIGGIWPGVATYLKIVSDYVQRYRGEALPLPPEVLEAARFGGEKLAVRKCFLRVPILPEGASLYARQVTGTALNGDVVATLRLSLLPPLASIAAVSYRLTGSDKGIW
jgi:hypothetical protein